MSQIVAYKLIHGAWIIVYIASDADAIPNYMAHVSTAM